MIPPDHFSHTQTSPAFGLSGMNIVITGASGGIGGGIARACAAQGANLLLHYHRQSQAIESLKYDLRAAGADCDIVCADLSQAQGAPELVAAAWRWRERIDGWVSNAGADVLTTEWAQAEFDERLQRLWEVDVLGAIRVGRAVGQRMQQQPKSVTLPCILHVGWDQAARGMPEEAGQMFGPTKAAVMAFSQHLAHHLAPDVRVNCLAPGWIQTRWGTESASDRWQRRARGESLLGQWGTSEDVAGLAAYLLSPAARFINGQIIEINGGWRRAPAPE